MEEMRQRLAQAVAGELSAAPESTAKSELVEELSDNLYQRYEEMIASGMAPEEAFQAALDGLGDADELVSYLNGLPPEEPLPGPEPQGSNAMSDLDELFRNVEEIVSGALNQAKSAVQDTKERLERDGFLSYTSPHGHVNVDFFRGAGKEKKRPKPPAGPEDPEDLETAVKAEEAAMRGELAARGLSPEEIDRAVEKRAAEMRASWEKKEPGAGEGQKDVIYGFGYDKAKGGWFTQWGEWKGPKFQDAESCVERREDGRCAVGGGIRGVNVETANGDIIIRMSEDPEGDVVIGGDVDDLEVCREKDGALTIRPCRTASSSFFFHRGLSTAGVELLLPRRDWDFLKVRSTNGDVKLTGDCPVDHVELSLASGDVEGALEMCGELSINCVNGDLDWAGNADRVQVESVSGDLSLRGHYEALRLSSMNGDIEVQGGVGEIRCVSISGDIQLETEVLPRSMEMSTKSGDIDVRIPDGEPFSIQCRTTSGDFASDFFEDPADGCRSAFDYQEGGPVYHLSSVSGDLSLRKF